MAFIVRTLLHFLSVALVLPGVALACAFVILGRAIESGSLLGLFDHLLNDAIWNAISVERLKTLGVAAETWRFA